MKVHKLRDNEAYNMIHSERQKDYDLNQKVIDLETKKTVKIIERQREPSYARPFFMVQDGDEIYEASGVELMSISTYREVKEYLEKKGIQ